jgi:DNA-binding MarR family transcriptional regulator
MAAAPKLKEALMPKLTDTQLVILSAAAQRHDSAILPLPKSLKVPKAAATTVLKSLLKNGLVAERPAAVNEPHWRKSKDGGRRALVITEDGLQAIGVEVDKKTSTQFRSAKQKPKQRSRPAERKPCVAKPSPAMVRPGTKQALLIDLLKRKKGATIETVVETLGWLPHTVRAALTRLRQQDFQIERVREDGVSRYRIAEDRKAA